MLEAALLTGIGMIFILSRMNLKRVAGYALFWDVLITGGLTWMFIGTYAGMVTGMAAGVLVSVFLTVIGKTAGKERLALQRKDGEVVARVRWKEVT